MQSSLSINPKRETEKIVAFLKSIQKKTGIDKAVIGLSGGIDSTTAFYLLKKAYKKENIIGVKLPLELIKTIVNEFETKIPFFRQFPGAPSQVHGGVRRSKKMVSSLEKVRVGNIMARVRMIILFDLAKKHNALVCGTENKSERFLGYFTRFGDSASDIEPITHLYKTQVYQLAKYLKVPNKTIKARPTAGLWKGQTDETELGFTYSNADQVLNLYFDQKISLVKIMKLGYSDAEKIIKRVKENQFKHEVPYSLLRK